MDFGQIFALLKDTYWANQRAPEAQITAMQNSYNVAAIQEGRIIGYARIVTDYSTIAWLCDVVVHPEFRGQGIGKAMLDFVFSDPKILNISRFILGTRDAHSL